MVDARDPLRYWSPDLQAYARELKPSKPSLMLLNKADLLPHHVRAQWADYLDAQGIEYLFWSAKAAAASASAGVQGELPHETCKQGLMSLTAGDVACCAVPDTQPDHMLHTGSLSSSAAETCLYVGPKAVPGAEEEDDGADERVQVVGVTELMYELEELARHARSQAGTSSAADEVRLLLNTSELG